MTTTLANDRRELADDVMRATYAVEDAGFPGSKRYREARSRQDAATAALAAFDAAHPEVRQAAVDAANARRTADPSRTVGSPWTL